LAILSELSLKAVELDVELNSASNNTIFDKGYREKNFDERGVGVGVMRVTSPTPSPLFYLILCNHPRAVKIPTYE
jgi:hypothetical protein